MFRIRRIHDNIFPANKEAIGQVKRILRKQFPDINPSNFKKIPELLANPFKYRFKAILYVAEDFKGIVKGLALLSYEPELNFCFLDYISSLRRLQGAGIGGALYERIREEALLLNVEGLFFECLPDDPALSRNPEILKQNKARLRFYEKYGARPIINTKYETPVNPDGDNPPYLVFDDLGQGKALRCVEARHIVREILERKYGEICSKEYVDMVVESFRDDPVKIRESRYIRKQNQPATASPEKKYKIALVVNDKHDIHHIRERGYVESPVRIKAILDELGKTNLFRRVTPKRFSEKHIKKVHDHKYIEYFKRVCANLPPGKSVYPYVFPIRNIARPPKELAVRAGYFCIDTFTPLNRNAYMAAKRSIECTLTATQKILEGYHIAYALIRPPGHHAERHSFGGFCYFNNAATAAQYLSSFGKVAILDLDYHHGNGQQDIFYERSDVLTISIHGHPRFAYPYFSGFADEIGIGEGKGYNVNFPLKEQILSEEYHSVLKKAIERITKFLPAYLIICLGLDTAKGDPTGTWGLAVKDYIRIGKAIGGLKIPTLVVQEGGYNTRVIGINARRFFEGFYANMFSGTGPRHRCHFR